jgi:hypothetical protein
MKIRVLKKVWQLLEARLQPKPQENAKKGNMLYKLLVEKTIVLLPPVNDESLAVVPEGLTEANSYRIEICGQVATILSSCNKGTESLSISKIVHNLGTGALLLSGLV